MQINTLHQARIKAVLGPTNTGKTYLALERMMAHASGMIGFPLRLLARENYDRVVKVKGPSQVALITGEERIVPPHARYFLCTVESMPLERDVEFIGIDEIQLCADPDRGHIFTDRLLNARGRSETFFMGSESIAPLIRRLIDNVEFEKRPRFSKLTYAGSKKITRLPARSCIVCFSASEVYAIAELIRRQKGGAAVVLGALSPRTRNAQVGLYQAGEVDYIVATDAVGMGLNMDVDHVAFAALSKFDGKHMRNLTLSETAQIAGRAGRFMKDGTFGVTADCPLMEAEVIERLEEHEFETIEHIYWRNSRLRFTSVEVLQKDLTQSPKTKGLLRPRMAEDERTLEFLSKNPDVMAYARNPKAVKLLWDVCQVPDFSKTMSDSHPRLLGQIFIHLSTHNNQLPNEWVSGHVMRLDKTEGDIDTLTQRLSAIRIWTYIAQRANWIENSNHWQDVTRTIEDKLSDALHEQLTKRFVDRRTSTLMKRLKDCDDLLAAVTKSGDVLVEGHFVGQLEGFDFVADSVDNPHAKRALNSAALKALRQEMGKRIGVFEEEKDDAFSVRDDGFILWRGVACARLFKGSDILHPRLETLSFDLLDEPLRCRVQVRLQRWLKHLIEKNLKVLFQLQNMEVKGAARGLAFQLYEGLGSVMREDVVNLLKDVEPTDRRLLRKFGVQIERHSIFCTKLLKPSAVRLRALLWCLFHEPDIQPAFPAQGLMSFASDELTSTKFYDAIGYYRLGALCVRIDMVERLASLAWERTKKAPCLINGDFVSLAGCSVVQMGEILVKLGYHIDKSDEGLKVGRNKPYMKKNKKNGAPIAKEKHKRIEYVDPNSPFAKLKDLTQKK